MIIRWCGVIEPNRLSAHERIASTPVGGGDVLERDRQLRQRLAQRHQHPLQEHRLAIEDVDIGIGDLAVHAQRHAVRRHGLQHRHDAGDVGDAPPPPPEAELVVAPAG